MIRRDLIKAKLERVINPMIQDLENNSKVTHRVGGTTIQSVEDEVAFQSKRKDNLEWCLLDSTTKEDIKDKLAKLESQLSNDELNCKYGVVKGLSFEAQEKIALIEDLEIALGIHPAINFD